MLPWNCSHCGTRHVNPVDTDRCSRDRRRTTRVALAILVMVVALFFGVQVAWSAYVYGDWKCAFAECRKVVP